MGLRDPVTEANVRKDLGEIALARDDLEAAEVCFEAAEALAAAAGARAIVAHCRLGQARVAQRLDHAPRPPSWHDRAADLFERLGDLDARMRRGEWRKRLGAVDQHVGARAAAAGVGANTAVDAIVAHTADQDVVAEAAADAIVAIFAEDQVVAVFAISAVVARPENRASWSPPPP